MIAPNCFMYSPGAIFWLLKIVKDHHSIQHLSSFFSVPTVALFNFFFIGHACQHERLVGASKELRNQIFCFQISE